MKNILYIGLFRVLVNEVTFICTSLLSILVNEVRFTLTMCLSVPVYVFEYSSLVSEMIFASL